jgi:hypothetical protein
MTEMYIPKLLVLIGFRLIAMEDTEILNLCEKLQVHNHVRYWNIIVMWNTGIQQPISLLSVL